jgi:hypothetical protein
MTLNYVGHIQPEWVFRYKQSQVGDTSPTFIYSKVVFTFLLDHIRSVWSAFISD